MRKAITVAEGDGIGPEIMAATLFVLEEAGAPIEIEKIIVGERAYLAGASTGITAEAWQSLKRTQVFLKAPITTPQGGGYRSLNVAIRGALGLYANVRPCSTYYPFVKTKHPQMDLVIIRENEEDLYVGMEYQQTPEGAHALKVITQRGCEQIIRYAFEYALQTGRKKVTAFTKDNILKLSDGLFHKVFEEIATEYPTLEHEHWIVDIGAAKVADAPEEFDVIVLPNLYGDIISDITAQLAGSIGLVGTANRGEKGAMFEAIHGSAPRRAHQNVANPSGLLLAAVLLLLHIQEPEIAACIHNAFLATLEDGIHTADIFSTEVSRERVGTREFAEAVAARLGKLPEILKPVHYPPQSASLPKKHAPTSSAGAYLAAFKRELVGSDLFVYTEESLDSLVSKLRVLAPNSLPLTLVSQRGVALWPEQIAQGRTSSLYCCRFESSAALAATLLPDLLHRLAEAQIEVVKTENLYRYSEGEHSQCGYSSPQV